MSVTLRSRQQRTTKPRPPQLSPWLFLRPPPLSGRAGSQCMTSQGPGYRPGTQEATHRLTAAYSPRYRGPPPCRESATSVAVAPVVSPWSLSPFSPLSSMSVQWAGRCGPLAEQAATWRAEKSQKGDTRSVLCPAGRQTPLVRGAGTEQGHRGGWAEALSGYKHKHETRSVARGLNAQALVLHCPGSNHLWDLG